MANLFSPEEDPRRLPGTSGAELTDLKSGAGLRHRLASC
jgi:hypothetical protein